MIIIGGTIMTTVITVLIIIRRLLTTTKKYIEIYRKNMYASMLPVLLLKGPAWGSRGEGFKEGVL